MIWLSSLWTNINFAIGNDADINSRQKENRNMFALSTFTIYAMMFAIGLFLGDTYLMDKLLVAEKAINLITGIIVFSLGTNVLNRSLKAKENHSNFIPVIVISMMFTQLALMFNLFAMPALHMLFHVTSIVTILFLYKTSKYL